MLFIHASLSMGGIETFFVRMAKERHKNGQTTKILLLTPRFRSDAKLLAEAEQYADIYFLSEVSILPVWAANRIPYHLSLLIPLDKKKVLEVVEGSIYVHVSGGFGVYMAQRLLQLTKLEIPVTIGLYHSRSFCWGDKLPFYERMNREFFFEVIPKSNIIFFNESMIDFYGKDFCGVNLFPLGVVENGRTNMRVPAKRTKLIVGSVGRLVKFKSYNIWMLDVIKALKDLGVDISYVVYGNGSLKDEMQYRINELGISQQVLLKGTLNYSDFSVTVSDFDVFVGSGTAIVEAASLGVPSIIGIENEISPLTYGFFSEIPGFSYNEDGLYEKVNALTMLIDFCGLDEKEKMSLSSKHIKKANLFSVASCNESFNSISPSKIPIMKEHVSVVFRLKYSISFFLFSFSLRIRGRSVNKLITN